MAGGKETPRQKMISLMYLVFIAMLALNVSKEVLDGFGQMFVKLEKSTERVETGNQAFYNKIETNSLEKKGHWIQNNQIALGVKENSANLYETIEDIKERIVAKNREKDPELKEYDQMDTSEQLDLIFFNAEGPSEEGIEFLEAIQDYKKEVNKIFTGAGVPQNAEIIEERFFVGDENGEVINSDGQPQTWLSYNFEGFPLISSMAKLALIQNDIRQTENDVLSLLLESELEMETNINESNYISLLDMDKGAYYQGEIFDGSILLGRKGGTQNPNSVDIALDGRKLTQREYKLIPGGIKLNVNAGNPGDHKLTGNLIFRNQGEESKISVEQSYAVISKPNSAVISADKMNVVYRGVENPMTISIPGIQNSKVKATASGLSKVSGSKYIMRPGRGREVTISASGVLPDGKPIKTSTLFRIKDIPSPTGTVRGETGNITIPKSNLQISSIGARLEDFDFDIKLEVVSFKFKAPGQPTIQVRGNRLDAKAKSALRRVKAGQSVQILDIKVQNPKNRNYRFKKVSAVICDIVN